MSAAAFSSTMSRTGPGRPANVSRATRPLKAASAPRRSSGFAGRDAEVGRVERRLRGRPVADDPYRRGAGGGQLVQPVVAAEHQGRAAARREHARHHARHPRVEHPDGLGGGARRVRQRPEEVEDRGRAELAAGARGVLERRVVQRREAERDADLIGDPRGGLRGRSMATPRCSSRSAAPHEDDAARLPCLTTRTPAAAATTAAIVETLTVWARSPPVPTRSAIGPGTAMRVALSIMPSARPVTSSTVSPLARSATAKPAICASVASRP